MNKLLVDVDGVLLLWIGPFKEWLINEKKLTKLKNINQIYNTHMISKLYPKLNFNALAMEFNHSEIFRNLPCTKKSHPFLKYYKDKNYEIIAITSCGSSSPVYDSRKHNLDTLFPGIISDLICLDLHEDKKNVLRKYNRSIWVEDSARNAMAGFECGHKSYLMSYDYNKQFHSNVIRKVEDWEELYHIDN